LAEYFKNEVNQNGADPFALLNKLKDLHDSNKSGDTAVCPPPQLKINASKSPHLLLLKSIPSSFLFPNRISRTTSALLFGRGTQRYPEEFTEQPADEQLEPKTIGWVQLGQPEQGV